MNAILPRDQDLLQTETNSFYKTMKEQFPIINPEFIDLKQLITNDELFQLLCHDPSLAAFEIEQRISLYDHTKELFLQFQNGRRF